MKRNRVLIFSSVYAPATAIILSWIFNRAGHSHAWILAVGPFWTAIILTPVTIALALLIGFIRGFLLLFIFAFLNYLTIQLLSGQVTTGNLELMLVVAPIMVLLQIPAWIATRLLRKRFVERPA